MVAQRLARAIEDLIEKRETLRGAAKIDSHTLALMLGEDIPQSLVLQYLQESGRPNLRSRTTGFGDGEADLWEISIG